MRFFRGPKLLRTYSSTRAWEQKHCNYCNRNEWHRTIKNAIHRGNAGCSMAQKQHRSNCTQKRSMLLPFMTWLPQVELKMWFPKLESDKSNRNYAKCFPCCCKKKKKKKKMSKKNGFRTHGCSAGSHPSNDVSTRSDIATRPLLRHNVENRSHVGISSCGSTTRERTAKSSCQTYEQIRLTQTSTCLLLQHSSHFWVRIQKARQRWTWCFECNVHQSTRAAMRTKCGIQQKGSSAAKAQTSISSNIT